MKNKSTFEFEREKFIFDRDTLAFTVNISTRMAKKNQKPIFIYTPPLIKNETSDSVKNIHLASVNVSHICNLRDCAYCYAKGGNFSRFPQLMSRDTGIKVIDWLVKNSGNNDIITINFAGGEPLLNPKVIRDMISRSEKIADITKKKFRFFVSTNGTIFNDEIERLISEFDIGVCISCDGTEEVHNLLRSNSFQIVRRNIDNFLKINSNTQTYCTITSQNLDVFDYAYQFKSWGINSVKFGYVSIDNSSLSLFNPHCIERLLFQFNQLIKKYYGDLKYGDVWYISEFYKYMSAWFRGEKKNTRCGAGSQYVNIGANGYIHFCHRFAASDNGVINTINSNELKIYEQNLLKANYHTIACKKCSIRYLCGGPCYHDKMFLREKAFGKERFWKCKIDNHLAKISLWLLTGLILDGGNRLDHLEQFYQNSLY